MKQKTKYKYLRNLNFMIAGASLGVSYFLSKKNHNVLALVPLVSSATYLFNAYDYNYKKKQIEEDEQRIEKITGQKVYK